MTVFGNVQLDKDIVMTTVQTNGFLLMCVPKQYKNNIDVIMHALQQTRSAIKFVGWYDIAVADRNSIIMAAVKDDGYVLKYPLQNAVRILNDEEKEEHVRDNKEIFMAAVSSYGYSLRYASGKLINDKDVVIAAVQQDKRVLKYASTSLQCDVDVLAAVQSSEDGKSEIL